MVNFVDRYAADDDLKLALQVFGGRHEGIDGGVLGIEIGADFGRQAGGAAHHLAPVLGAQPGEIVGDRHAVEGAGGRSGEIGCRRRRCCRHVSKVSALWRKV